MEGNEFLEIEGGVVKRCNRDAENVVIPEGVTKIGGGAFKNCSVLSSVSIPEGVTAIGGGAFKGCTSLGEITFGGTAEQWEAVAKGWCLWLGVAAASVACADGTAVPL